MFLLIYTCWFWSLKATSAHELFFWCPWQKPCNSDGQKIMFFLVDLWIERACTLPNIGVECSPRAESMWFWFVARVRRAWKNAPYMPLKGNFSRSFHFCGCFSRILPRFWASKLSFASCSDFMGFRAFLKFENFSHCKHWKETHALGLRILFYIRTKRFWWIGTARSSHSMLWLGKPPRHHRKAAFFPTFRARTAKLQSKCRTSSFPGLSHLCRFFLLYFIKEM